MLNSEVALSRSLAKLSTGELVGIASATQCPTISAAYIRFKASYGNTGRVYLGIAGVTKAAGTTTTTAGFQLNAGDDTGWLPIDNLDRFYRICDSTADCLTYMILSN